MSLPLSMMMICNVCCRVEKKIDEKRKQIKRLEKEGKNDEAKRLQSEVDELKRQVC